MIRIVILQYLVVLAVPRFDGDNHLAGEGGWQHKAMDISILASSTNDNARFYNQGRTYASLYLHVHVDAIKINQRRKGYRLHFIYE
mmetsp:Transcript_10118/g.14722  ORF Transcript_10118/g.14722 Transcript_10118/m.14722 type:complete len:86 (+) Transcript_10118:1032-1289(+)